jgi:predicted acetyltransferase
MELEIAPATDADYPIVCNLARFYLYDMAEHAGWHFPADGLFDSGGQFANYWGRHGSRHVWPAAWRGLPFLIQVDGHPAGFALVKRERETPPAFDMGEFFIARQYRRCGVGRRAATALFDRFVGSWEVRQMPSNKPAQAFWRRIITDYTGGVFTEAQENFAIYEGREFIIQRFQTRAGCSD